MTSYQYDGVGGHYSGGGGATVIITDSDISFDFNHSTPQHVVNGNTESEAGTFTGLLQVKGTSHSAIDQHTTGTSGFLTIGEGSGNIQYVRTPTGAKAASPVTAGSLLNPGLSLKYTCVSRNRLTLSFQANLNLSRN